MKLLPLLSMLLLLPSPAYAYVYGYTRLYRKDSQTTIDLLYDWHVGKKELSHEALRNHPLDTLRRKLFPTERRVQKALESIHARSNEPITLVWESAPHMKPRRPIYMSYGGRIIENRRPNCEYIHSDRWRLGCSSNNTQMPAYPSIDRQKITQTYGPQVLAEYMKKYSASSSYNEIADLEILANVLGAPSGRIIVYAGGGHSKAVSDFLTKHANYEVVYSKVNPENSGSRSELNIKALALLDKDAGNTPYKGRSFEPARKNKKPKRARVPRVFPTPDKPSLGRYFWLALLGSYFAYYLWENYGDSQKSTAKKQASFAK